MQSASALRSREHQMEHRYEICPTPRLNSPRPAPICFAASARSPNIEFIAPEELGILDAKLSFGAVGHLLRAEYQCRAVAVGWFHKASLVLGPSNHITHKWTRAHRIVAIVRHMEDPGEAPASPGAERFERKRAAAPAGSAGGELNEDHENGGDVGL